MFSWCLTHYRSPGPEKGFIFLRNFIIRYSSWAENFLGLISASAFCDHEYINWRCHFAVAVLAHCVISMQMAKVWKRNKLHKRILPCFITALFRRKINKGTLGKFGAIISATCINFQLTVKCCSLTGSTISLVIKEILSMHFYSW